MRIELLGTGGFFPNDRRHTPCVLLPELGLAFDAGSSTFRLPAHWRTRELDIYLTHAHFDHIVGLPFLLLPMLQKKIDQIRVHGLDVTLKAVREHLFSQPLFPADLPFDCREIPNRGGCELTGGLTLNWQPLASHPGGSLAFRIDRGSDRLFAYVTDTTVDGTYHEFIRDCRLLVHECYFPDEKADLAALTGHSHSSQVAQLARDCNVGRLVLVHVDPDEDRDDPLNVPAMRSIFPATELAVDGLVLEV